MKATSKLGIFISTMKNIDDDSFKQTMDIISMYIDESILSRQDIVGTKFKEMKDIIEDKTISTQTKFFNIGEIIRTSLKEIKSMPQSTDKNSIVRIIEIYLKSANERGQKAKDIANSILKFA